MIKKYFISSIFFLSAVFFLSTSPAVYAEGEPLFKFGCLSDIHSQQGQISAAVQNIRLRTAFKNTLDSIRKQENLDLLVLGGDYTSDVTITQTQWNKVRSLMEESTRSAFNGARTPVIYVNGNHDYEVANFDKLPKLWNAGDFYTTPMKQDIGELIESESFYEFADNGTAPRMKLLAAYHYVINGFDFVVLNAGKYFFASAWDYQYSNESVAWVDAKLDEIYAENPNKTVFFLAHLPFSDSRGAQSNKGLKTNAATNALKSSLAKHPNLIYLYGHDHSSNQIESYIKKSTSQRVTQYDSNGNVFVEPVIPGEGGVTPITNFYIQSVASNSYLGFDAYNLGMLPTKNKFTVANSTSVTGTVTLFGENAPTQNNGYIYCGSSGRFSGNSAASASTSIYIYQVTETAGVYTGTQVAWPENGKTYALVAKLSGGGYFAISNLPYSSGSTSQRMVGVSTLNSAEVTFADNTVLWKFTDATGTSTEPEPAKKYYIQDQNGDYLDYSDNLAILPNAIGSAGFKFSASTVTSAPFTGTSSINILSNSASQYIHCGTNGLFSANLVIGDSNKGTSLWIYKVEGTTATRVSEEEIVLGGKYLIIGMKSDSYYQLLNTNNGSAGAAGRMLSEKIGTTLTETITFNENSKALWTITEKVEEDIEPSTPSFISSFMGSMRYNSLASNSSPGINDSPIIQALMVYVYRDSVVLNIKNYGQTGFLTGSSITTTIGEPLDPYITKRTVLTPQFNFTTLTSTSEGSASDAALEGSTNGTYDVYDQISVSVSEGTKFAFDFWNIKLKNGDTTILEKSLSEIYTLLGITPPADLSILNFKQADWSALLVPFGLNKADIEATAMFVRTGLKSGFTSKAYSYLDGEKLVVKNLLIGDVVTIHDLSGRIVAKEKVSLDQFATSECKLNGVYFIKIECENGNSTVLKAVK